MLTNFRAYLLAVLAGLMPLFMLAACSHKPPAEQTRPVQTMTVKLANQAGSAAYAGTLSARTVSDQGFRVAGTVIKRLVEVGQHVTAGQALLQLDPSNLDLTRQAAQAQLNAAKSQAAQAKVNLERDTTLVKQNFISQAEYDRDQVNLDNANAQLQAAQAQYDQASNQADYGTLRAAVTGVVTAINADVGEVVTTGKTAVSIAKDGDREVVINVPESRVDQLRAAQQLSVTLWAAPGKTYAAKLREIDPAANKTTGTYDAHVTVLKPDAAMLLGMTAYVHVVGGNAPPSYTLPLTAIYYQNNAPAVWLVSAQDTVSLQPVTLEAAHGNEAWVSSGLKDGDVVVTAGVNLLNSGEKVLAVSAPNPQDP